MVLSYFCIIIVTFLFRWHLSWITYRLWNRILLFFFINPNLIRGTGRVSKIYRVRAIRLSKTKKKKQNQSVGFRKQVCWSSRRENIRSSLRFYPYYFCFYYFPLICPRMHIVAIAFVEWMKPILGPIPKQTWWWFCLKKQFKKKRKNKIALRCDRRVIEAGVKIYFCRSPMLSISNMFICLTKSIQIESSNNVKTLLYFCWFSELNCELSFVQTTGITWKKKLRKKKFD